MSVNTRVAMTLDGVSVLIDLADSRLPAIIHWGCDLRANGVLTGEVARAVAVSGLQPIGENCVDDQVRVAVLPESWTGWVGRPGLSGSRRGRDWSPKFTVTAAQLGGEELASEELVQAEGGALIVQAEDREAQLGLLIRIELVAGGLLRAQASVINTGPEPYSVNDMVLAFPVPSVARELMDLGGRWGRERAPQRRELTMGTHLREGRHGRTGADAATVLHLGTPGFNFAGGEIWGVHVGWSGNHTHYAELLPTGEEVIGGGELLLPGEVELGHGESYTTPWVYGSYGVGLDAVAHRFHKFLRARPNHPSVDRPVTLNVWEAVHFDHQLEPLLELADIAARVGVERYVLDDGWFGSRRDDHSGLGDWTVSVDAWPNGLHPLVDRVRELGMQFGLWFEPEMVNLDSNIARAHPDWVMATGGRTPVPSRHQQVINLGIPECYAYVRDSIMAILDEYDIGYVKWDHNRDLVDAGTSPSGVPGVHAQTSAYYRLLDEILAAHPGLEIESCSSGGGRVDLGVMERASRVWVSDCIDPLDRLSMNRWTMQLLPPEMLGSHIASERSQTTGRSHDLNFRAAVALFGHFGIEWDLRQASEADIAELSAWIAFYKSHRTLLSQGNLFRLDFPDPSLVVSGIVAPDQAAALYVHASVSRSPIALLGRIRFPGLNPDRNYRVTPALVGSVPSGLEPPPWWGVPDDGTSAIPGIKTGIVMPGQILMDVGLAHAPVNPEHCVVYEVRAV